MLFMAMLLRFFPVSVCFGITAIVAMVFLHSVDLKPEVGENFFFSKNDPQVRSDNEISRTFPGQMTEIDFTVSGDIASPAYADRIHALSVELAKVPGVTAVISINPGPKGHGPRAKRHQRRTEEPPLDEHSYRQASPLHRCHCHGKR